jgi:hypothetical protein
MRRVMVSSISLATPPSSSMALPAMFPLSGTGIAMATKHFFLRYTNSQGNANETLGCPADYRWPATRRPDGGRHTSARVPTTATYSSATSPSSPAGRAL